MPKYFMDLRRRLGGGEVCQNIYKLGATPAPGGPKNGGGGVKYFIDLKMWGGGVCQNILDLKKCWGRGVMPK